METKVELLDFLKEEKFILYLEDKYVRPKNVLLTLICFSPYSDTEIRRLLMLEYRLFQIQQGKIYELLFE